MSSTTTTTTTTTTKATSPVVQHYHIHTGAPRSVAANSVPSKSITYDTSASSKKSPYAAISYPSQSSSTSYIFGPMDDEYDYLLKLLVIGDSGVGKSALLRQYSDHEFIDTHHSTIGVDFEVRTIGIENRKVKMQMWDTAGQERFKTITSSYYKGAMGVIIVFDVTDEESFRNVRSWRNEVFQYRLNSKKATNSHSKTDAVDPPVMLLVANKCDLTRKRVIENYRIEELATELGCAFVETSAKNNINVQEAFHMIAAEFVRERKLAGDEGVKAKEPFVQPHTEDINNPKSGLFSCCKTQ